MEDQSDQINTLIELNDELENYFRNTIIPQLFVDAHLILRKFTPPAMRQFKLALTDVGRPISDLKENLRFPAIVDNILHVIESGEILEKEIQTTDMRWYQMNIIPYVLVKENKTNGVIITFVEITMRIKDFKEQEKLISEHEMLLDTISHDIKSPLTALNLTVQMLKMAPERGMEKFPFLVDNLESSLVNMQHVITELTKSRWQKYRYEAVQELLNVEHIIEDVRMTLAPQINESHAIVSSNIGASEIVFVRRKLRSLLYNLVNNAIKYASPGRRPEILIKTEEEDGHMIISVIDNGIGIARENFKTIFGKYQRFSDSADGNGVGLYLVKEIVNSVEGKITVESEVGIGSIFKVSLKLKDAARSSMSDKEN